MKRKAEYDIDRKVIESGDFSIPDTTEEPANSRPTATPEQMAKRRIVKLKMPSQILSEHSQAAGQNKFTSNFQLAGSLKTNKEREAENNGSQNDQSKPNTEIPKPSFLNKTVSPSKPEEEKKTEQSPQQSFPQNNTNKSPSGGLFGQNKNASAGGSGSLFGKSSTPSDPKPFGGFGNNNSSNNSNANGNKTSSLFGNSKPSEEKPKQEENKPATPVQEKKEEAPKQQEAPKQEEKKSGIFGGSTGGSSSMFKQEKPAENKPEPTPQSKPEPTPAEQPKPKGIFGNSTGSSSTPKTSGGIFGSGGNPNQKPKEEEPKQDSQTIGSSTQASQSESKPTEEPKKSGLNLFGAMTNTDKPQEKEEEKPKKSGGLFGSIINKESKEETTEKKGGLFSQGASSSGGGLFSKGFSTGGSLSSLASTDYSSVRNDKSGEEAEKAIRQKKIEEQKRKQEEKAEQQPKKPSLWSALGNYSHEKKPESGLFNTTIESQSGDKKPNLFNLKEGEKTSFGSALSGQSSSFLFSKKKDEEEDDEGDDDEPERSPSPEADPSKSKGSYKYEETLDVISAQILKKFKCPTGLLPKGEISLNKAKDSDTYFVIFRDQAKLLKYQGSLFKKLAKMDYLNPREDAMSLVTVSKKDGKPQVDTLRMMFDTTDMCKGFRKDLEGVLEKMQE